MLGLVLCVVLGLVGLGMGGGGGVVGGGGGAAGVGGLEEDVDAVELVLVPVLKSLSRTTRDSPESTSSVEPTTLA